MGKRMVRLFDGCFYPDFGDNWDEILFRDKVLDYVDENKKVLDLGAGAGINEHLDLKGVAALVCGIDTDDRVLHNPFLDEAKIASAESIPYEGGTFDVVVCDNVLEHLMNPKKVFREVHRVLKRKGWFIFKTPNRYHYVTLVAKLTPHWFHVFYNKVRGRRDEDTFPTCYKANVARRLVDLSESTGFEIGAIKLVEGRPEYLRVCSPLYLMGILYEKFVNSSDVLRNFRVLIIGYLKKK